jgi:DNA-binding CsgD family transcriptional regulator
MAAEKWDSDIAQALGISVPTVRYHLDNIHAKSGSTTRTGTAVEAVRRQLIQ